jgi:hypothetical protein
MTGRTKASRPTTPAPSSKEKDAMNRWSTSIITPRSYGGSGALRGTTLAIALLVLVGGRLTAVAYDATPTATSSRLATLGYPELRLVATDEGAEAPREVAAGRYLVVLENRGAAGGPANETDVNFLQLPPGATLDELNSAIANEGAPIPDWYGDIVSSGGFNVAAGQTGYGVVDLQSGEWVVGVGDTNPFTLLTVTENGSVTPVTISEPSADLTVELSDFAFDLPNQVPAGHQVWHATNVGDHPHEMVLVKTPELLTVEQVLTIVSLPEGGTPPPGVPDPASFEFVTAGLQTMSSGREIWVETELTPGYYVAVCFVLDPETGQPHALLGMVDIFTVGESGTPAA